MKAPERGWITVIKVVFEASGVNPLLVEVSVNTSTLMNTTGRDVKSITVALPSVINATGFFMVTLSFQLTDGRVKSCAPFGYQVFDGLAPRLIEINPSRVPTAAMVMGRKLNLQNHVSLMCANFPDHLAGLEDLTAVLSPSLQVAHVLEVKQLVICDPGIPDCNRTLIILRLPALDASGVQALVVSRNVSGSVLQVLANVSFVPSCDHDDFCRQSDLMVDFKKLSDDPIPDCNFDLCFNENLIGDPVVVDFSPKAGGAGTMVSVRVKNLPAFSAENVAIIVRCGGSEKNVSVSHFQQSVTSTLTASQGELRFEAPEFAFPDEFATIEIGTRLGDKLRVAQFDFEYLPNIAGRAIVQAGAFSPSTIMEHEDLNLFVTVKNVHRIEFPYHASQLLVEVDDVEIASMFVWIISSDRTSTSLSLSVLAGSLPKYGPIKVGVGSRIKGNGSLGLFNVSIVLTPAPMFRSSFPALDAGVPADKTHIFSVQVAYLDPALASRAAWTKVATVVGVITEGGTDVMITDVVSMMSQGCKAAYCSVIKFTLTFPPLIQSGQDNGGDAVITIETLAQGTAAINYTFPPLVLTRAGHPSVVLVKPASVPLGGDVVTVFLMNFPTPNCKTTGTCVQDAAGLTLKFQNVSKPTNLATVKDMLKLTFTAPHREIAGKETGKIILNNTELQFSLAYDMPPAGVSPKDGRVGGGDNITISAMGWYSLDAASETWSASNITNRELSIKIGENSLAAWRVVSVGVNGGKLVAVVTIPAASNEGKVSGSISARLSDSGTHTMSRFVFQYFKAPVITSVSPTKATLSGKTSSEDGRSVLITIKNFPPVTSPSQVRVSFGLTVCSAGATCNIVELRSFKVDGTNQLQLRVNVPPVINPGDVIITVNDTRATVSWSPKIALSALSFFTPLPAVRSVRWCERCNTGRSCIVMGNCHGGKVPLENLLPFSGGGTMIITVDDPPARSCFVEGDHSTNANISLDIGDSSYGAFQRRAHVDVTRCERVVLEFSIPELSVATGDRLTVHIKPVDATARSSASAGFSFFDKTISIKCLKGCEGSAKGANLTVLALTNFPLDLKIPLLDQVVITFGDFQVSGLDFCDTVTVTCIKLSQPECINCIFRRGALTIDLAVEMKADKKIRSMTSFTYWAAPVIVGARMNTVGNAVNVLFDQNTDMAMMTTANSRCDQILTHDTLSKLATLTADASCVWKRPDALSIFLGTGATIVPGDMLVINKNVLKSSNSQSETSVADKEVKAPEFMVAPSVSIQGTSAIDPCSELELRALVDSPRQLRFQWSCSNDDNLAKTLRQFTGAVLFLAEGTTEMSELDKIYQIVVTATDFLGARSDLFVYPVLKTSSPAPKLTFSPSTLSVYRDETVSVKVVAEFSKCPIAKGSLVFGWSLKSSTSTQFPNGASIFEQVGSHLWISAGVLVADHTYTLAVTASMDSDPSISSVSTFSMDVEKRELAASIRGGTDIRASTTRELVLDASDSVDPDVDGQDHELKFAWMCSIVDGGISNPCRDKDGVQLVLPGQKKVILSAGNLSNMHPTATNPYIFKVEVSKLQMTPKSFQMPVTLTTAAIPAVWIGSDSGKRLPGGQIRINANDQFAMSGACSVINKDLADMTLDWTFVPDVTASLLSFIADESAPVTSKRKKLIIAAGSGAFFAGSSYVVEILCTDSQASRSGAQLNIVVNSPPRGDPCTSCRIWGSECATTNSTTGEAIFDTFRLSCMNWADDDGSLQYQFGYTVGASVAEASAVPKLQFDWGESQMADFILPPGEISFKARVRDGFGGSTEWMDGGTVSVEIGTTSGRRLLEKDDTWERSKTKLLETLDLGDYSQTNQVSSAISIQVDIDTTAANSTSECMGKKEILLHTMSIVANKAIKTPGFICEVLSIVATISNEVKCINMMSTQSLSNIVKHLSHSKNANSLPVECSQNLFKQLSQSLISVHNMRQCNNGTTIPQDTVDSLSVGNLLNDMDSSMQMILQKSSKDLITGQALYSTQEHTAEVPKDFAFIVKKLALAGANFSGTMTLGSSNTSISFDIPKAVRDEISGHGLDTSVLFSSLSTPPVMGQVIPISPFVTLTLAGTNGLKIDLNNLSQPVEIQIPIFKDKLCSHDMSVYSGKGRCLYWNNDTMKYSPDGCTTKQSDSANYVTCKCNHLTSFVVENVLATNCAECPAGKSQTAPCSDSADRVCTHCPMGSYNEIQGQPCLLCGEGKYSSNTNAASKDDCVACAAGKYLEVEAGHSTCSACPANSISPSSSTRQRQCVCNIGFIGLDGGPCTASGSGSTKPEIGSEPFEEGTTPDFASTDVIIELVIVLQVFRHSHMFTHAHAHVNTYMHVHTHRHTHAHTQTHTHTHTHTTHTHTHAHTQCFVYT